MTDAVEPSSSFPIGRAELRREDPRLLRGQGRYTDDLALPGQAYAATPALSRAPSVRV